MGMMQREATRESGVDGEVFEVLPGQWERELHQYSTMLGRYCSSPYGELFADDFSESFWGVEPIPETTGMQNEWDE